MSHEPSLGGIRVLVTRAEKQAADLCEQLRSLGADVEALPTIEIVPPHSLAEIDNALQKIDTYDWLVLTSVNGVDSMFARIAVQQIPLSRFAGVNVAVIGPATARRVEARGLAVTVIPPRYVAESLADVLREQVRGKRVLLLRAAVARDILPEELRSAGAEIDVVAAYETVMPEGARSRLLEILRDARHRPQVVTFTSSSTVRNLMTLLAGEKDLLRDVKLASIGPVTSATLAQQGCRPHIQASEYTIPGLVQAIAQHFAGRKK